MSKQNKVLIILVVLIVTAILLFGGFLLARQGLANKISQAENCYNLNIDDVSKEILKQKEPVNTESLCYLINDIESNYKNYSERYDTIVLVLKELESTNRIEDYDADVRNVNKANEYFTAVIDIEVIDEGHLIVEIPEWLERNAAAGYNSID